ncbi:MAG: hypothetical protein V4689_02595 [Verrucomicrobiota bacterium]
MSSKCLAVFLFGVSVACAEMRDWRSADGSKDFRGEFVKQSGDSVTIRNESGKELAFSTAKLHADDLQWLKNQAAKAIAEAGVFGGIRFGDTEGQVIERLKTNPYVIAPDGEKETAFGTADPLVNVKTRLKPGGAPADLSFVWGTKDNITKLVSFDITCDPQTAENYNRGLRKSLEELTELLVSIHGKPGITAPYPSRESLLENEIFATNSWILADNSSLEVGVGLNQKGDYLAVARYQAPIVTRPTPPR